MNRRPLSHEPGLGLLLLLTGCEVAPTSARAQFMDPPAMGQILAQLGAGKSAKSDAASWRNTRSLLNSHAPGQFPA